MQLYNTKSRKIEKFIPYEDGIVRMYTCGPTVYHYAHIGNLRSYIMEDVLEKTLNYIGYNVKRVMNITDVGHLSSDADTGEDKMLKGAKRENKSVLDIAQIYTEAFFEDFKKLNIKKPEIVKEATAHIDDYIKIIEKLLETGYAYKAGGNIYFDTSKLTDYYVLTNHKEEDKEKKNKSDFVLWFTKSKFDDQELKWDSPFGYGYPGWHIECSGISMKYLGEYLDIHCGGVDNIFPHHTNEIAQSEAYLGHSWCKYWMHIEHLNDSTGKMSKSKGEFLTVSLLEQKGYNPLSYRLFCLSSHYRKQLVFSFEELDRFNNMYEKMLKRIFEIKKDLNGTIQLEHVKNYKEMFKEKLKDDLNTANALTVLYEVIKNEDLTNDSKLELIKDFDKVLSLGLLDYKEKEIDEELKKYIEQKIEERKTAKENKNYELADLIRKELEEKGIIIKDTRDGVKYEVRG